ncbi:uncharacterized protein LOC134062394 [Sardina pilchardus]|uniref:uncharacterized protein LOC134062394 n=1 Tax=Sardina pilchardus TaxID=27697 RepID=UPI002E156E54
MASVGRQSLQVWMVWLLIASCGGLKEDDVLKSPKKAIFNRQDYSIHAKSSPQPSVKQVLYYGHLTMGTKKLNLSAEENSFANDAELFNGSSGDRTDYQSDSYSHVLKGLEGVVEGVYSQNKRAHAVDRLLGMKPKVECVEDSMTLKLHGAAALGVPVHIDRGNAHPLSLSEMPPVCGYEVRRSWRDLVFSTPYDGCFVAEKESIYVLPLVISGIPVSMACPSIAPKPPSVSCHASGMTVKIESSASAKDVQVKVNSKWQSLIKVSPQCGFSVVEHPDGVIISVTYVPCIEEQDGMLTFEVAAKGDFKISCPSRSAAMAIPPSEQPKYPNIQFPSVYNPDAVSAIPEPEHPEVPQLPQRPILQSTPALPDPVYPKKPAFVKDSSKYIPPRTARPVPSPAKFPFYSFKPEFYQPAPKPDCVSPSPKPELSEVPQLPERPVPQTTPAPLGPVYVEKPTPVEDPSKTMHGQNPEHMHSPGKFPYFFFKPGFYPPDRVAAIPESDYPEVPEVLELPQRPALQPFLAPPDPVYPTKPALVEDPPKSRPDKNPEHGQFPFYFIKPGSYPPDSIIAIPANPALVEDPSKNIPPRTPGPAHPQAEFPFYPFKPEFHQPAPEPDCVSPSPKPELSEIPQLPQRPLLQPTPAPKKPLPVEAPPKSRPEKNPEYIQFPFYSFKPEFYQPAPKPDCVSPSPKPELSEVPQLPKRPVPQTPPAPLGPVYVEKPTPVEDPSKTVPGQNPEHMQSPGKFPYYFLKPGFYPPDSVAAIPESDYPEVPEVLELPQRPVLQPSLAPPDPVYPTKPALVEDPPKSRPDKNPEHGQFPFYFIEPGSYPPDSILAIPANPALVEDPSKNIPPRTPGPAHPQAEFPFYPFKPESHQPAPKPDCVSPSPKPELSEVPQLPERPFPQTTPAPLGPVYVEKPTSVENPSKNMPGQNPEHVQSPGKFPYYFWKPGFYPPGLAAIPEPEHPVQLPQRPVLPSTPAPKKPVPVGPPESRPFFKPEFYQPAPKPDCVSPSPKPELSEVPQLPERPFPQTTQAPLGPFDPKWPVIVVQPPLAPTAPAHPPTEAPIHRVYQIYPIVTPPPKPKMPIPPTLKTTEPAFVLLPTTAQKTAVDSPPPNNQFHQSTHCSTVCSLGHSNCCPLALSFHQHLHHHNHFAPDQSQVVQPASATSYKEPTYIQQLFHRSGTENCGNCLFTLLNTTQKSTSIPLVQTGAKPISPQAHQIHQLPISKLESNQPVEPLPYQWLQNPYDLPNPESTSTLGHDIPANRLESISSSSAKTLGLHRVQAAKDLEPQSTVKHSVPYSLFQIPHFGTYPPPPTKPNTHPETLTFLNHPSLSSSLNIEVPSSRFNKDLILNPKPIEGSVPHPWVQHLFFNPSVSRQNMQEEKLRIPDVSSDSKTVQNALGRNVPVVSSGLGHQTVPVKVTAGNGNPTSTFKPGILNLHPKNIGSLPKKASPQSSIFGPSGEHFATHGSPLTFQQYWKPVRPHHEY